MLPSETECVANTDSLCLYRLSKHGYVYIFIHTHTSECKYKHTYVHTSDHSRRPEDKPVQLVEVQRAWVLALRRLFSARFDAHLGRCECSPRHGQSWAQGMIQPGPRGYSRQCLAAKGQQAGWYICGQICPGRETFWRCKIQRVWEVT